jgi:hypothetical protein
MVVRSANGSDAPAPTFLQAKIVFVQARWETSTNEQQLSRIHLAVVGL